MEARRRQEPEPDISFVKRTGQVDVLPTTLEAGSCGQASYEKCRPPFHAFFVRGPWPIKRYPRDPSVETTLARTAFRSQSVY